MHRIDDFHAMFSGAGVGCLVGSIGAIGSFIASICTTCGICKARDHVADEEVMRSRAVAQLHYYDEDNEVTFNNTGYPVLSDHPMPAGSNTGEKKEVGPHKVVVVTDVLPMVARRPTWW